MLRSSVHIEGVTYYPAEPLDDEAIGDFIESGFNEQLLILDGAIYDTEDLFQCSCCDTFYAWRGDLDDELECEDCAAASEEERRCQDDLESWARWACR